jgi:hypothetical protein
LRLSRRFWLLCIGLGVGSIRRAGTLAVDDTSGSRCLSVADILHLFVLIGDFLGWWWRRGDGSS